MRPAPPPLVDVLFEAGAPARLMAFIWLPPPIDRIVGLRALLVFLLGWAPLAILSALPSIAPPGAFDSFIRDPGPHARFAIAAPLLVFAYVTCARRLGAVARHFPQSGLLNEADLPRFFAALETARHRVRSGWAETAAVILAYAVVFLLMALVRNPVAPSRWQLDGDGFSPAGWWQLLVSVPILLIIIFGWVWRIFAWTLFLRTVAGLNLRLIAAHPDQAGGLGFLTQSVRAFALVGAGLGSISAGRFANVHLVAADSKLNDGLLVGGTALIATLLCVGPLLVFTDAMMLAWRRGAMTYGSLAAEIGGQFEATWLDTLANRRQPMLDKPDFSATTDLYGVVSNVYNMRFTPVEVRSLIIFLGCTLAPFVVAMFLSMPFDVVVSELKGLLF